MKKTLKKMMNKTCRIIPIAIVMVCLLQGLPAQTNSKRSQTGEAISGNPGCPEMFFELIGDLPGDCISSIPQDISSDGLRVALMSEADEPDVPNDGGSCDPYLGFPHSNEAAGWTRPCEGLSFFTPPISGPGGIVGFGYLPGANPNHNESVARGISPDGKVAVGWSNFDQVNHVKAVVISKLGMKELAKLDSGCMAMDVSQDGGIQSFLADPDMSGRIVIGYSNTMNQYAQKLPGARAVYWDDWGYVVPLPLPAGSLLPNDSLIISSDALCISDDGKIIGGNLYYNRRMNPYQFMSYPCVWKLNPSDRDGSLYDLLCVLDDLPGGDISATINHISGDGKVLVGIGSEYSGDPACWGDLTTGCVWTLASMGDNSTACSQPVALLNLDGYSGSYLFGTNYDGTVIVGASFNVSGPCNDLTFDNKPVIWYGNSSNYQPNDISAMLGNKVPEGWLLITASRVSADGKILTGGGFDPDYNYLGWVAGLASETVPISNWALLLGIGLMLAVSVLIYRKMNN